MQPRNDHYFDPGSSTKPTPSPSLQPKQDHLWMNIAPGINNHLREGFPKKVAVLLDLVQMRRGGGPCQKFLSTFHKLYILDQFGHGEGGGDPCPIFLAHWRSKKVVQVVHIRGSGGGVEVIWTKAKRTATF